MKVKKRAQLAIATAVILIVATFIALNRGFLFKADIVLPPGESQVLNLTNNGDAYTGSSKDNPQIPKYEKFELTFDVNWYHNRDFTNPTQKYDPITDGTINPYWPYDENTSLNDFWETNYTTWDYNADYSSGNNNVDKDGVIYGCTKSTPSIWKIGNKYNKDNIVRVGIIAYKNIYNGEITATIDNGPGTPGSNIYWQEDSTVNMSITPGGLGNWQEYWVANPPDPIAIKKGISVDGIFSNDNWASSVTQPGFWYQDYIKSADPSSSWLYPNGNPQWKIRFSPTTEGQWSYKIRVRDITGQTEYVPSSNFTAASSQNRGFAKVSPTDTRYFETSDGQYLSLVGQSTLPNYDYSEDMFKKLHDNGINLIRPWWQGSQGPVLFGLSGQGDVPDWKTVVDGKWGALSLSSTHTAPGQLFSGTLNTGASSVSTTSAYVKPNTNYRFSALVKTVDLQVADGGGVYLNAFPCTTGDVPLTQKITTSQDWTEISGNLTTNSTQNDIGYLKVNLSNRISGAVYFTNVSLKEDLGGNQYGSELLQTTNFNKQNYVSQLSAFQADSQTALAKKYNVYMKIVLEEKDDIVFGNIGANGLPANIPYHNSRLYENVRGSQTHAGRIYQNYYWRYVIARYGHSTAIHSFDLFNEDDPFNSSHYSATDALASYFKQNDPNHHLITTSNWHSFPTSEFWSNPNYSNVDYADWHKYVGQQDKSGLEWSYMWNSCIYQGSCGSVTQTQIDTITAHSFPNSLHLMSNTNQSGTIGANKIPIQPSHKYQLSWYMKGQNISLNPNSPKSWQYPTIGAQFVTGWWSNNTGPYNLPGVPFSMDTVFQSGQFDWTKVDAELTAPSDAHYIDLTPQTHWLFGDIWFDDITITDITDLNTPEIVQVPDGNFDEPNKRIDLDSALMAYSLGMQIGTKNNRVVNKPVIRGEAGISGNNIYGADYKGYGFTGENQQLVDDTEGVWYRKFIWAELNPFGAIEMYWWNDNIFKKELYKYAKSYQNFISGIALSNGKYQDIAAQTSDRNLRAWGQKETDPTANKADKAHLWIDNAPYTWKNVVDAAAGNATLASPISGTVTVPGMKDGWYKVEWWDTSNGSIITTDTKKAEINGDLVLSVSNLVSDTAVKIYATTIEKPLINITSPNEGLTTLDSSTTVAYTVDGQPKTKTFDLQIGDNQLEILEKNAFDPSTTTSVNLKITRKDSFSLKKDNYSTGWNMVAFPHLTGSVLSKSLPDTFKIRKYNPATNSYDKLEGSDTKLSLGTGYWIKIDDANRFENYRYEAERSNSSTISVTKGWNFLGNPYDTNLLLSNLTVKYKNGSTVSYAEAIARKDVSGYVWSYESKANPKQYYFVAIEPDKYNTSAHKETFISPLRGFWMIVRSEEISDVIMNK